jgi:protein involved in polysaccharide export with SLBB domain
MEEASMREQVTASQRAELEALGLAGRNRQEAAEKARAAVQARTYDQTQRNAEALAKRQAELRAYFAERSARVHTVTMMGNPALTYRVHPDTGERVLTGPPPAPAGTRAQALDVAVIWIEGETALPTEYRVREDGTIDVPLLGAIAVNGLTASQIAERMTKELTDRRLAIGRRVTAMLHRP